MTEQCTPKTYGESLDLISATTAFLLPVITDAPSDPKATIWFNVIPREATVCFTGV
jgi:hypothetical protein